MTVQVKPARPHNTADPDSSKWAPPSGSDRQTSGQGGDDEEVGSDAAEDFIQAHPWVVTFGRIGWAAKGVVYLLTGVLAFTIVADPFGSGGGSQSEGEADPAGAVATIAQQPFGELLLWTLAIGLFIYALWRIVTVLLPADVNGHSVLRRIGYLVSAVVYIVLGLAAVSLARRPGSPASQDSESQDSQVSELTRSVFDWTGGRWLVFAAGALLIGIAVYFFWKGVTGSFENEIEHRSVGPLSWDVIRMMGRVGWIGRAAMVGLIGVFLARAAYLYDPEEAGGLDDSLRRIADNSLGMVLVIVVALGLSLYGAFCIVSAPIQKLVASDEDTVAS